MNKLHETTQVLNNQPKYVLANGQEVINDWGFNSLIKRTLHLHNYLLFDFTDEVKNDIQK